MSKRGIIQLTKDRVSEQARFSTPPGQVSNIKRLRNLIKSLAPAALNLKKRLRLRLQGFFKKLLWLQDFLKNVSGSKDFLKNVSGSKDFFNKRLGLRLLLNIIISSNE